MSTSGTRKYFYKSSCIFIGISLFCNMFQAVYSNFSHGVSSIYMSYMFLVPFFLGCVVNLCIALFEKITIPDRITINLYNSGIATLTMGSLVKGILDIAGTVTHFQKVFWISGSVFLAAAVLCYMGVLISGNSPDDIRESKE